MVLASTVIHTPAILMRRVLWLLLGGLFLSPLGGCTTFQSASNWMGGQFSEGEQPINHVLVRWDNQVRSAQDSVNHGEVLSGMMGRVYLQNDQTAQVFDAHGSIVVNMYDMTSVAQGKPPVHVAEWIYDSQTLKQLKRKDMIGLGYTLFLPWESYSAGVKQVKLLVKYVPDKGSVHLADASMVTLQAGDESVVTSRNSAAPTSALSANKLPPPTTPQPRQQPQASYQQPNVPQLQTQAQYTPIAERQVAPGSYQPPPPGTTVQYLPPPPR